MSLVLRKHFLDTDRFFNTAWAPANTATPTSSALTPRVDVVDAGEHFEITAELPGVSRDKVDVQVKEGVLTLEAESARAGESLEASAVLRQERPSGTFKRSFNLGKAISESQIQASLTDGLLTLVIPKQVEKAPEAQKITIQ